MKRFNITDGMRYAMIDLAKAIYNKKPVDRKAGTPDVVTRYGWITRQFESDPIVNIKIEIKRTGDENKALNTFDAEGCVELLSIKDDIRIELRVKLGVFTTTNSPDERVVKIDDEDVMFIGYCIHEVPHQMFKLHMWENRIRMIASSWDHKAKDIALEYVTVYNPPL